MHPFKILFSFVILLFISFFAKAQGGTIKVQRSPVPIDSSIMCGGVLQRSHLIVEFRTLQPINRPAEVFYVPKNYSVDDYIMQNGFGVHIILSNHRSQINYNRSGTAGFSLITGFDHIFGKEGDSILSQTSATMDHYKYSFNMVPINLKFAASLINKPKFFMSLILDGGENFLFSNFSFPPSSSSKIELKPSFGGGLGFYFKYRGYHSLGLVLKAEHINTNWFREVDLVIPFYFGRYKRP